MNDDEKKEAIEAMKRASTNMKSVLDRVSELERALASAIGLAEQLNRDFVPAVAFVEDHRDAKHRAKARFATQIDALRATL